MTDFSEEELIELQKILRDINIEVIDAVIDNISSFFDKRIKEAVKNKQYHIQLELFSITHDFKQKFTEYILENVGLKCVHNYKFLEETFLQ